MANQNFQYSFITSAKTADVFAHIINPRNWWVGFYGESIDGKSEAIGDEFSFRAGEGMHYTQQKLVELVSDKKIVWLVTESNLSFLDKTNEWEGTKICFDIEEANNKTRLTFTHKGLVPEIECYNSCSIGWTKYLQKLQEHFK